MKLTMPVKLAPTPEQHVALLATMRRFNAACDAIAVTAFKERCANKVVLQKLVYYDIRRDFGLSAQLTIRAISKTVEAYKRDQRIQPRFRPEGAVPYDERIMSWKGLEHVSLLTLEGRALIATRFGEYQAARLDRRRGQADLVLRNGTFFLFQTIDVPEPPTESVPDYLGVDLGVVNLAVDADGRRYSGAAVEVVRQRHHRLRQRLQRVGTRGARKKLKRLAGREARFRHHENHCISKALVTTAKDTARGLALENLEGIRVRTRFRRGQRAKMSGWAFGQLRAFVGYKAALAAVPFVIVDPRNTSRICSRCGHCEKGNRKNQAEFRCLHCASSLHADVNAARNIGLRAACKPAPELARLAA